MTPELEPVERIFRAVAIVAGRPWPPDRWLGAKARLVFVHARIVALRVALEALARELDALDTYRELVASEGRELLANADQWCLVAEELARVMAREEDAGRSPWARTR